MQSGQSVRSVSQPAKSVRSITQSGQVSHSNQSGQVCQSTSQVRSVSQPVNQSISKPLRSGLSVNQSGQVSQSTSLVSQSVNQSVWSVWAVWPVWTVWSVWSVWPVWTDWSVRSGSQSVSQPVNSGPSVNHSGQVCQSTSQVR